MSAVYTVLSPWAQSDHLEKRPINPRLDTLEGKTIGLYASFKEYHPFFMQEVERQLDVFETSSPSYPLMVSLDGCVTQMAEEGPALFAGWRERLDRFSAAVAPLRHLRVLCHGIDTSAAHPGFFAHDSGKILVSGAAAGLTGAQLAHILRKSYGFETEMACGTNLLAMTSVCDADDALDRLADALLALDAHASPTEPPTAPASARRGRLPAPSPRRCACPGRNCLCPRRRGPCPPSTSGLTRRGCL